MDVMNLFGRTPLKDGTKLICRNGDVYTICGEPIGAGGYSIVYSVKKQGESSFLAVKECYPLDKQYRKMEFVRENGVVKSLSEEGDVYLKELAIQMRKEKEYSQVIFNYSLCVVKMQQQLCVEQILSETECFSGEKAVFFLMDDIRMKSVSLHRLLEECKREPADGHAFRFGGLPPVHITARIISEILSSVNKIHTMKYDGANGYLHGDIQEYNIFFQDADLDHGELGISCLLDLGCMKSICDDGYTEPAAIEQLGGAPGYIPPEMLFGEGRVRLGVQADIYSVGRLFLYLLTGTQYIDRGRDRIYYDASLRKLSPAEGERIGCRRTGRLAVNKILAKALAFDPEERYPSALSMKQDMEALCELTAPRKYSLPSNLPGLPTFKGRVCELEKIDELFSESREGMPVWLYGVGGIGKTELAIRYGTLTKKRDDREVFRVIFKKTLMDTIASLQFIGDDCEIQDKKQRFSHNLNIMDRYFRDALLIIDDLEIGKGGMEKFLKSQAYQSLIRRSFRVLFTTRYDVGYLGLASLEVGRMSEQELCEVVNEFYPVRGKKTIVKKLIHEVGFHTLTVELVARTLAAEQGTLSPEELLECLLSNALKQKKTAKVLSNRNRKYDNRQLYGHIRILFRLNRLKDKDKITLAHAVFFPAEGLDQRMYETACEPENIVSLKEVLIPRGWIIHTTDHNLVMHPLLAEICKKELETYITESYYAELLNRMIQGINLETGEEYRSFFGVASYLLHVGSWFRISMVCHWAGIFYLKCFVSVKAKEALKQALKYVPNDDAYQSAVIYKDLCDAYYMEGKGKTARLYGRKAIKILTESFPDKKPELASANNNLGMAYGILGNLKKKLRYHEKAIAICREGSMVKGIDYAIFCNNMGSAYTQIYDYADALPYYENAVQICKEIYGENHPWMAVFYNNLGDCYNRLNQHVQAYRYLTETVRIGEQLLSPMHKILIAAYLNLAVLLSKWSLWKDFDAGRGMEEACKYARKAMYRVENQKFQDRILLADCYSIYGYLQYCQSDYSLARAYAEKALRIREELLPGGHINLLTDYHNMSLYCSCLGMDNSAEEYREKEIQIKVINRILQPEKC